MQSLQINSIEHISSSNFKSYGKIIEYPKIEKKGHTRNLWRIIHTTSEKKGWRIAYLVLRDKSIGRLESHINSDETLEPISGKAILVVNTTKNHEDKKAFWLDKPVILFKGVWHGLISPKEEAHIKITENATVTCKYLKLPSRINTKT